jgi:hypothetical protein
MYRRVLEISRKDPDPLNVQLLEDLGNLCRVLQTEGKIDEAISITLEIQAALERFGGEDHPFVRRCPEQTWRSLLRRQQVPGG